MGLLIITTLIILFYSKPNIETIETKTYSKLIGLNFLFLIVGISTYIIAKLIGNFTLISILQKVYMSILTLLNLYSVFYCISIYDKESKYDKLKKIFTYYYYYFNITYNNFTFKCCFWRNLIRWLWIIKDIEPIYPIKIKGKLNIWNYEGKYKLINKLK